jgi:hypothetical protein
MAINPTSFPTPQAFSGGVDFSPLANLGNVIRQGRQQAATEQALAQLGPDPVANTQFLIKSGVPELVQAGIRGQAQQQLQAERQREFGIEHQYDPQREGRAQAQEQRTAESAERDTPEYRRAALEKNIAAGIYPPETRNDPAWRAYIETGQNFPAARVGLGTPSYVVGPDQKYHEFRPSTSGQPVETVYPQGYEPLPPEEVARRKSEAQALGKTVATAKAQLPALQDQAETNIRDIQSLIDNKEGREAATGTFRGRLDPSDWRQALLLGSKGVDFANKFKQVAGGEAYLSGIGVFRGLGHLSNQEGDAAKSAYNRMNRATSSDEFESAAKDAQRIYRLGLERTQRAAKGDFSGHPSELTPPGYEPPKTQPPPTGGPTAAPKSPPDRYINQAKAAIAQGADKAKVRQKMIDDGYDPGAIGQ